MALDDVDEQDQHWDDLPREAKSYLKRLSDWLGRDAMVSTGARRGRRPGAGVLGGDR
jgi:adenylosuccinate synthase